MGVPNNSVFSLQDVVNEIPGTQTSLKDCVDDATSGGYDSNYYSSPATSLKEFRNYSHTTGILASPNYLTWAYNLSGPLSEKTVALTIVPDAAYTITTSGDDLFFLVINEPILNRITVSPRGLNFGTVDRTMTIKITASGYADEYITCVHNSNL